MGDDDNGNLECRLTPSETFRKSIETLVKGVKSGSHQLISPYVSILKHPEKPFYAFGDVVENVVQIPVDFYNYLRGNVQASFEKKVSRSLAIAETVVLLYGAKKGAHVLSYVSDSNFHQAAIGGFVGSEVTTAAVFFLTYLAFTSVINLRSRGEKGVARKLTSAVKETCRASLVTIPASVVSFASADLGIVSLIDRVLVNYLHLFDMSPGAVATIGAIGGALLYTGAAKIALQNSAEQV